MPTKTQKIIAELKEKIDDYESSMSMWLDESNQYADLYRIKPPNKKSNTYSNPRLPEMHTAVETLATTALRMMTAQDPYFELRLMDFDVPDDNIMLVQKTLETQLKVSRFKANLTRALRSLIVFGTVFVEEPFEWTQLNPFGRKMPITGFLPRSIIQMGFDRSAIDILNADWKYTNDIISKGKLRLMCDSDALEGAWDKSAVEESISDQSDETSNFIRTRLSSANYSVNDANVSKMMEFILYKGDLDCLGDGARYICGLVNRKYLVKFLANPDQNRINDFRIAKWIDYECEPLGYGLGRLLARQHRSMDANRQKVVDQLSIGVYNIWLKSNMAGINAQDLIIRPNKIIGTDDMNGLKQLVTDSSAAVNAIKLEEILKQDFRTASGATDQLQAISTDATATVSAIVQNSSMRRLSVYVENIADPLIGGHIEKMHNNNRMNLSEPFIISTEHGPRKVYPKDLNIDIDIEVKIVTDKDFKPKRGEQIIAGINALTSIRQENPDKYMIDTIPLYKEYFRGLDIDPNKLIRPIEEAAQLQAINMMVNSGKFPGPGPEETPANIPLQEETAQASISTPIGPVSGSVVPEVEAGMV